jgi:hypothetical protein
LNISSARRFASTILPVLSTLKIACEADSNRASTILAVSWKALGNRGVGHDSADNYPTSGAFVLSFARTTPPAQLINK